MSNRTETNFKANLADLTKIPPIEFEKHFHEWMERDDVARGLQAKLRCDLIKNFNKTNLGKLIISHTTTASGGSSTRLTLSPLRLALNTLVAEFLYAQNCHFTLSVFCTEIPFCNTLPDFESTRNFRFNNAEIAEIWEAVTGSVAIKNDLNKHIIQNYETNPNVSLLLLIVKCLLEQKPIELSRKSVEIQTETHHISHKSTSVQVEIEQRPPTPKSSSKSPTKDDNFCHINNYLLTLSEKVNYMTKEFEQFTKQRDLPRPIRTPLRSSRSRDYVALNKSLERITENMKHFAQAKRKSKRLSNIVESINNLTKQFGKCAQNFDNVTKVLSTSERKSPVAKEKPKNVRSKEKQTETELQEKTYADWIHEMRTTKNGQKFLDRVETSLRKALTKHREQLQNETDIKMKHLRSAMKLHYQQKLSKHLLQQDPKENFEENRKLKENIEMKLQQFEIKQMALMQKLNESSIELQEAQRKQKETRTEREEEKLQVNENILQTGSSQCNTQPKTSIEEQKPLLKGVTNTQKHIPDMAKIIAEQEHDVDHIIYEAKLRMQQLESESNQLEQNFQLYLDRRKREQLLEQQSLKQNSEKILVKPKILSSKDGILTIDMDFNKPGGSKSIWQKNKSKSSSDDEEFQRMKEKLQESEKQFDKPTKSTSSLEIRNAILEAKIKFFDHERTSRKSKEQELEIQSEKFLHKKLDKYQETFQPYYCNEKFGNHESEANICITETSENQNKTEFNVESSLSEINIKDKTLDEEQQIILSPMTDSKSEKLTHNKASTSVKRELFAKDKTSETTSKQPTSLAIDLGEIVGHQEPKRNSKDLKQALKGMRHYAQTIDTKEAQLLKKSMTKMQQLFEQQPKELLTEMVNEIEQHREIPIRNSKLESETEIPLLINNTTTSTTVTTNTTTATSSSFTNEKLNSQSHSEMLKTVANLNRISNTSMPSILNLLSESEESLNSINKEQDNMITIRNPESEKVSQKTNVKEKEAEIVQDNEFDESFESSEYKLLPTAGGINKQNEAVPELGEDKVSSKASELNFVPPGNEVEIGELLSEPSPIFAPIDDKLNEDSSETSSDFEISTGHQDKQGRKARPSDDSESDFWA